MREAGKAETWKIAPLGAPGAVVGQLAPDAKMHVGNPFVLALSTGRLLLAYDQQGPGVATASGPHGRLVHYNHWVQGRLHASTDRGQTWPLKAELPFGHPCLFRDGNQVYALGHRGNLQIVRSSDGGETWSRPAELTAREGAEGAFVSGARNVWRAGGRLYTVLMRSTDLGHKGDPCSVLAPVLLHAAEGSDLLSRRAWTMVDTLPAFRDFVAADRDSLLGVPYFDAPDAHRGTRLAGDRWVNRIGWGASHVLHIADPAHPWHAAGGRVLHLLARAAVHRSNVAVLARLTSGEAGFRLENEAAPSGRPVVLLPLPGGHLDFGLMYDETSRLYWLASNQPTDSLARPETLDRRRHGLPCEENHRLALHFSSNLADWCFAGLVDAGANPADVRQAPSLAAHGADLFVAACAGRPDARTSQFADSVRCYRVAGFRELAY